MAQPHTPWFEKYPDRFESEAKILQERGFLLNENLFQSHRVVRYHGSLPIDPDRRLTICFPEEFPSLPPQVFDSTEKPLLFRHHDPNTRQLCLFGFGGRQWCSTYNSINLLNEAAMVIETFSHDKDTPDDDLVPEPISNFLIYQSGASILIPPNVSGVRFPEKHALKGNLTFKYAWPENGTIGRGVVTSANAGGSSYKVPSHYVQFLPPSARSIEAILLFLPDQPTQESFREILHQYSPKSNTRKNKSSIWLALVFPEQSGSVHQTRISWVFARIPSNGPPELIRGIPYRADERMTRIPNLIGIQNAKAAFIGCGCLGSKIAVSLAASGVQDFSLIDCDFMEPYNSVRHEVGVKFFGVSKMEALAHRMYEINPEVIGRIKMIGYRVGATINGTSGKQVYDELSTASIIIDTTGSHGVSRWLNEISFDLNIPAVYASVTNGAWGGEVVRVIPGKTACWRCWNDQFADDAPPGEPSKGFFPPGCNQPSFTGTTYDAAIIAGFACSLIVDTFFSQPQQLPTFGGNYIRWSGRDEYGTPILKSEILPIRQRPSCQYCNLQ